MCVDSKLFQYIKFRIVFLKNIFQMYNLQGFAGRWVVHFKYWQQISSALIFNFPFLSHFRNFAP